MWSSWYSNLWPLDLQPDALQSALCSPTSGNAKRLRLTRSTLFISSRVGQSFGSGRDLMGRAVASRVHTKEDWINVINYLPFLLRKQSLYFRVCFLAHGVPSENVIYPKRKEFAFCLHQTSFQKEGETILTDLPPLKFYPIPWDKKFLAAQPEEKNTDPLP